MNLPNLLGAGEVSLPHRHRRLRSPAGNANRVRASAGALRGTEADSRLPMWNSNTGSTGIGVVGAVVPTILLLGESTSLARVARIVLIVVGFKLIPTH
jgi:hypothetical protein